MRAHDVATWVLFLCLLLPATAGPAAASPAAPGVPDPARVPIRVPDPVIVNGAELRGAFDGVPAEDLRVLAWRGDRFEGIPFQVDERGPLGDLLLTQGLLQGKQRTPGGEYEDAPGFGVFGPEDEIVFLARQMGDRAPEGRWPEGAVQAVQIRARDPRDGDEAWAVAASFDVPPPRSPDNAIDYRVDETRRGRPEVHIVSTHYHAAFTDPDKPVAQSGWQVVRDGRPGPNILKTFHSIIDIRLGFVHFDFTLENIVPRRLGQIDGPVRVVRRIRNNVKLAGIPVPEFIAKKLSGAALDTDSFYYPDFFYFNGKVTVPQVLVKYGERSKAIFTTDMNRNAVGSLWVNARNRDAPCLVDGVMSPQEQALDPDLYKWSMLYGAPGGWMNILTFGAGFRPLDVRLYYMDNALDGHTPAGDPSIRAYASTGYRVKDFHKIEHGESLEFTTYVFPVDPDFQDGDEQRYVDLIFHPLEVSVPAVLEGEASRPPPDPGG